jgi:DNA-binding FrmR family transcriptional regulator
MPDPATCGSRKERRELTDQLNASVENPDDSVKDAPRTRILNRLKRLEGQVRGLQRMVEDERSCQEVLTLLTGIRSALTATGDLILEEYVERCSPEMQGEELAALMQAVRLARG